jgi:hypothetical protein
MFMDAGSIDDADINVGSDTTPIVSKLGGKDETSKPSSLSRCSAPYNAVFVLTCSAGTSGP